MLNRAQVKCIAVFSVFMLIGFGPISPGCLIGFYVVWTRPQWFWQLLCELYQRQPLPIVVSLEASHQERRKVFLRLLILFVVDILPLPVTPVVAFVVILRRPEQFFLSLERVYGNR